MTGYAETKFNISGAYMSGLQGVSTGLIIPWSTASVPSGFLECNGASVSTSTYAALFAVIAYTYGGSGANFNLPDLQDKVVIHKSNNKALASTMGANTVANAGNIGGSSGATTLSTAQIPSHSHSGGASPGGNKCNSCVCQGGSPAKAPGGTSASGGAGSDGSHSHSLSATFTGSSNSVLQPYLTLMYIIKT
jgi:microcystin-dependent protein